MILTLVSQSLGTHQELSMAMLLTAAACAVGFGVLSVLQQRFTQLSGLLAGLIICLWLILGLPRVALLPVLLFFLASMVLAGRLKLAYGGAIIVLLVMCTVRLVAAEPVLQVFDYELLAFAAVCALAIVWAELRSERVVIGEHQQRVRRFAARTSDAENEHQRLLYRSRVSSQMQDELAHNLAVACLHTNAALDASTTDTRTALSLIHTRQAVTGAMDALRRTIDALGQQEAPEELSATLEDVERIATSLRDTGVEVDIHSSGLGQTEDFPLLAMRIIREAATNAVKHADPTQMVIWIKEETDESQPPHWVVSVRNNGVRPPVPQPPSGHGLTRLRAKAEAEGGTMEWGRLGANFLLSATVRKDGEAKSSGK